MCTPVVGSFQLFHDVAYRAEDQQDLLDAINEFLDESIVLPPGEWDKKTLLPIMDMARKKAQAKRKVKEQEEAKGKSGTGMLGRHGFCLVSSIT